jgi:hypothetical protein
MSSARFDTDAAVKRLSAAGFSEQQAGTLISVLSRGHERRGHESVLKWMFAQGIASSGL